MKEIVNHPTYGEIIYDESFWVGKKSLTVNGVDAKPFSKKEFSVNGDRAVLKGSFVTGVKMHIKGESIELSPKPKWYEAILALIPLVFLLTWGNVPALCAIFPVIGGAIGGAVGALFSSISLILMKQAKSVIKKILIGIGLIALTLLASFILAILFISVLS